MIHHVSNIELELESYSSPSYELDNEMKDYFEVDSQTDSRKQRNYDESLTKANDKDSV